MRLHGQCQPLLKCFSESLKSKGSGEPFSNWASGAIFQVKYSSGYEDVAGAMESLSSEGSSPNEYSDGASSAVIRRR